MGRRLRQGVVPSALVAWPVLAPTVVQAKATGVPDSASADITAYDGASSAFYARLTTASWAPPLGGTGMILAGNQDKAG
jgi:hypothetical protein